MIRMVESRPPQAGQYRNYSRLNEETDWTNAGLDENPRFLIVQTIIKWFCPGGSHDI